MRPQTYRPIFQKKFPPVLLLTLAAALLCGPAGTEAAEPDLFETWVNTPVQVTSRTEPLLHVAVSADGREIIYITGDQKPTQLWVGSADPSAMVLPEPLPSDGSAKAFPAISADNRYVAYTGYGHDVKGDIYLIDRKKRNALPSRLTRRDTADEGPCFSLDGRRLYFHQAGADNTNYLVYIDLTEKKSPPQSVDTQGDALFCCVSPDGERLAFVSFRKHPSGDLFVFDMKQGILSQITSGPEIDLFPQWSPDGDILYFSRIGFDTNGDHHIDSRDNSIICRIKADGSSPFCHPVTPLNQPAYRPYAAAEKIYFLSNLGGVTNCWALPMEGTIRSANQAAFQLEIAEKISNQIPYDPYLSLLAYHRVFEIFPDSNAFSAKAAYAIGNIFERLDLTADALFFFEHVRTGFAGVEPEASLAEIQHIAVGLKQSLAESPRNIDPQKALLFAVSRLNEIAAAKSGAVAAEARIESANILLETTDRLPDFLDAINRLDSVLENDFAQDDQKAHALYLKALIHARTASPDKTIETFRRVIAQYPGQREWVDRAVAQILDLSLANLPDAELSRKIEILHRMAEKNRTHAPALASGALNRIADLYYAADQPESAKATYWDVIDAYPGLTTQTAAARLSLAEILFEEERFRQALDLYETEIRIRPSGDRIYQLARKGYIQKTLSAGEFLYRLGEIPSARNTFKELIDYDPDIVAAHRGYIKCAAATGDIDTLLETYRAQMASSHRDPVPVYATALCMTYLEGADFLDSAEPLLKKAIRMNGSIEYFYQTLGYVNEVLETAYGRTGRLNLALESYQKAYFLNDHQENPENAANLELNLGSAFYLLGQYHKALVYYTLRRDRKIAFSHPDTETLFYKRLGECAFQAGDLDETIQAYTTAVNLVRGRMDPGAPSQAFDRLHRFIMDRIVAPAQKIETLADGAEKTAKDQSALGLRVADLTQKASAPPSPEWRLYKKGIQEQLERQKKINDQALKLAEKIKATPGHAQTGLNDPAQQLHVLTERIIRALEDPERLMTLEAEILDRLGLAYQESEKWEKAADTFDSVFQINLQTEKFQNLAVNRRSASYNRYHLAQALSGNQRIRQLQTAAAGFQQAIALVDQYGVPQPEKKQKEGLIDLSFQASLDETGATQAAHGFSAIQERRIAETFLSRIQLELGNLKHAEALITQQLSEYPMHQGVSEKDIYGVALLYHRAGLLAHAQGNDEAAFARFAHSATLTLRMGSPASTLMNLTNMAAAAEKQPFEARLNRIQELDEQAKPLISESETLVGASMLLDFHNRMGVFYAGAADTVQDGLEGTVQRLTRLHAAITHFQKGIALGEKPETVLNRKSLETLTRLYLNQAMTAAGLGNPEQANDGFEKALEISRIGMFPDLQWRALVGLGRTREALDVLETMTVIRAECAPFEIITAFGPMVFEALQNETPEAAFDLAEQISELERYHRTSAVIRPVNPQDAAFYREVSPRLETLLALEQNLADADPERKDALARRIADERRLLDVRFGENMDNLPEMVRRIQNRDTQARVIRLMGAALEAEAIATAIVDQRGQGSKKDAQTPVLDEKRLSAYHALIATYRSLASEARNQRPLNQPSDFISFMEPEPVVLMDVMEVLFEDDSLIRIFSTGMQSPKFIVFFVTPEGIDAGTANDTNDLTKKIAPFLEQGDPYIAYEAPLDLRISSHRPYALSGTHLFRCIESRKPFKDRLLAVPGTGFGPAGEGFSVPEFFRVRELKDIVRPTAQQDWMRFSDTNTLLVLNGLREAASVPVRPQDRGRNFFAVSVDTDTQMRVENLLSTTPALSSALLAETPAENAYRIGHLFSLYGCSSLIFFNTEDEHAASVSNFLEAYSLLPAIEALRKATPSAGGPLFLGYKGMTREAADDLAAKNFIQYVKTGKTAFDQGDSAGAVVMFENAVATANRVKKYEKYLPDLYRYGRESAYRAGDLNKALGFADDLAKLMEARQPGGASHAEALLQLGLIHSKMEAYEQAIPLIESSVDMMSTWEPDLALIRAMTDLGVVLENATNYENALSRFQKAADLSQTLDQSELLAAQHLNIGRIHDLRLSQYATAILSYQKALAVYRDLNDLEKISEALLDIGRCYRLLGNFSEADRHYQEAMETISGRNEQPSAMLYAKILIEMANNAWFQGRYEEAFRMQRECYAIAEKNQYPLMQVISLNTSGLIWWTLGDYDKSISELERALEIAQTLNVRQDEIASTLNNIGLVYRDQGRYQKALETFEKALEIDAQIRSQWAIAYDYRNMGLTYLRLNQPEKAAPLFDKAFAISESIGNRINAAKALLGKGDALFALADFKKAESAYQQSLSRSAEMRIRETQWRSLYGLARINLTDPKDLPAAETRLRDAMNIIEQLRSDIKIDQLKENFIANKLSVYKALVALLADMQKPAQAFEVAERSRARNFIDLLGNQKLSFSSDADNRLYQSVQTVRSEIEAYESLLAQSFDAAEKEVYQKTLNDLNNRLKDIMLDIEAQNPQLSSLVSVPPVEVEGLARLLEPGVALLSYYVLDDELFCWVLKNEAGGGPTAESLKLVRIPADSDELKEKILEYRRVLQNLEPYEKHSKLLYDRLMAPVMSHLQGVHTLGIIPHGPLHYLSFATLYSGDDFLVDRFSLFYLPSAGLLEYTLKRRTVHKKDTLEILAIGNPDLGDPILNLPFAEQEVNAIAWDFPKITVLTRDKATEDWVVDNIAEFDIIHFASHGEFDPVNPLLSAIKLAASDRPEPARLDLDGDLKAKEIFGLKLKADMVFLSACQTGLGKIRAGDEVIGLNRSFLYAGTHTVVSSLWRVSDVSTAVLIKTFYRRYTTGNKAESLAAAARHVRMRYPHPGYWGAFTLVGDYY